VAGVAREPEKAGVVGDITTLACPTTVPAGWFAATVLFDRPMLEMSCCGGVVGVKATST